MSEDKIDNLISEIFHEIDILNKNNKMISKYTNNFDLKKDKKPQILIPKKKIEKYEKNL
jgi:hypothetical protein